MSSVPDIYEAQKLEPCLLRFSKEEKMSEHRAALFENCVRCLLSVLLVMVLAAQPMACAGSSAAQPKKPEDSSSGKAERLVIHHARLVSMTATHDLVVPQSGSL